ncbi:MAG TPA: SHOCT domain-containing protein [Thermomicrobiales bacterium]|nr:SHOCT domain-containing protein [Thermomicrobiales bacterium]
MMRRPMARGRRGILGTVATTAVVAGTATAVSNRVTDHQVNKQAAQTNEQYAQQAAYDSQAQLQDMQAQMNTMQAQQVQAAATPAGGSDMMAQLQQLTQLKEAGALTDAEFTAAKAKLLGI